MKNYKYDFVYFKLIFWQFEIPQNIGNCGHGPENLGPVARSYLSW